MIKLKYCTNCIWSIPEKGFSWNLNCTHPIVNAEDSWALSSKFIGGTSCRSERERTFWSVPACGKAGKLWEEATK